MELIIIFQRHAKHDNQADGPITAQGKLDLQSTAQRLIKRHLIPNFIMASQALRGRKSAEAAIESFWQEGIQVEGPVIVPELNKLSNPQEFLEALHKTPDNVRTLLCISHEHVILQNARALVEKKDEGKTMPLEKLGHADAVVLFFSAKTWKDVKHGAGFFIDYIPAPL